MSEEIHIASMIVHVLPEHLQALQRWIESQLDVEIRADSPQGKLVLVVERAHQREILGVIDDVEQQTGVLSCTMVYHEVMNQSEGDQELVPVSSLTD